MKTLNQNLDEYLAYARSINQSPVHLRIVRYNVLRLLRWLENTHGVTQACRIIRSHLEGWIKYVPAQRTTKGLPLKINSVGKLFECARTFLIWLQKMGLVPMGLHEVVVNIKRPDVLPTSVLMHAQMVRLLEKVDVSTAAGLQMRAMLEVLYSTGIRVTELLSQDLGSIDFERRLSRVMGKGGKERMVPIGHTASRFTESYLKGVRPLLLRDSTILAVWLDGKGKRFSYHAFRRHLLNVCQEAGLPVHVTAHTFRRSCATELIRGGANLWHVRDLLGHASVDALKPYIKLTIVDLKKTHAKCHPRERKIK